VINTCSFSSSVFRTHAWVQAWLDMWGKTPGVTFIDLGGRGNVLDYVYTERRRLKKIIPFTSLHLAGVGGLRISSPRAEYNNLNELISIYGDAKQLARHLKILGWHQFKMMDVVSSSVCWGQLQDISEVLAGYLRIEKVEPAYQVSASDFSSYKESLGSNTRLKYFNRRVRLAEYGSIEFKRYDISHALIFFGLLNDFHVRRWGQPCYSMQSQLFMVNFQERLVQEGGSAIMEAMLVNGEIVSVIYDIVYAGKRYNFQSGFSENRFEKIALGSIHLGYAIEEALSTKLIYDFMAGTGKIENYKANIANQITTLGTVSVYREPLKYLFHGFNFLSKSYRR